MIERGTGSATSEISVLHVDDEVALADLVATFLERERDSIGVESANGGREAIELFDGRTYDCIVCDYDMPDMDGLAVLKQVRKLDPSIPFILYTGKGSEEIASRAIAAGVTDYLQKRGGSEQYTVLANRIVNAVDRQRAGFALEESQRQLSTLLDNLPGMAYRCRNEPGWSMEFVSDGVRELLGYDPATVVDESFDWEATIIHPDDVERVRVTVEEALTVNEPFTITYRARTREGEIRWLWEQGEGVQDDDGELQTLEGFVTDVTGQKLRERDLDFFRKLVEQVQVGIGVYGSNGRYEYANPRYAAMLGTTPERLDGSTIWSVNPEFDPERFAGYWDSIDEGDCYSFEAELRRADGELVPVEGVVTQETIHETAYHFGTIRDVSERDA